MMRLLAVALAWSVSWHSVNAADEDRILAVDNMTTCDAIFHILTTKMLPGLIHEDLHEKYAVTEEKKKKHEVWVGEDEEWPVLLSGSFHLIEEPVLTKLVTLLKVQQESAGTLTLIQRVALQCQLRAAFEILYLEGIDPAVRPFNRKSWDQLLKVLAKTILKIGFSRKELKELQDDSPRIREELFKPAEPKDFAQIYSVGDFSVHDAATQFRRAVRFYCYRPDRHMPSITRDDLEPYLDRTVKAPLGSIAVLEENAIIFGDGFGLIEVKVPLLYKKYIVDQNGDLDFSMYKLDRSKSTKNKITMLKLENAESWANIDLPNIPYFNGRTAYRVPFQQACNKCHSRYFSVFAPTYVRRENENVRVRGQKFDPFVGERTAEVKRLSAEYAAMLHYMYSK